MRQFRLPTLIGLVAAIACGIALFMPMTEGKAIRIARAYIEKRMSDIDLKHYKIASHRQGWTGSWYVDFRRKDGPDGILIVIDYPEESIAGPDVYPIEYISHSPQGLVPAPGYAPLWEQVTFRFRTFSQGNSMRTLARPANPSGASKSSSRPFR